MESFPEFKLDQNTKQSSSSVANPYNTLIKGLLMSIH